jgi:hypothetical protein
VGAAAVAGAAVVGEPDVGGAVDAVARAAVAGAAVVGEPDVGGAVDAVALLDGSPIVDIPS